MKRPSITAPISDPSSAEKLIEAGAGEFFCGMGSERYRFLSARNYASANLKDFGELKQLLSVSKRRGVPVYLCVNSSLNCRDIQGELLEKALALGVSGFMLSDPALIRRVRRISPSAKIAVSTLAACMNSSSLGFFRELGADRVVLERQHTLGEIRALAGSAAGMGLELEIFIKNLTCTNINGSCLFHGMAGERAVFSRSSEAASDPRNNSPCRRGHSISFFRRGGGEAVSKADSRDSRENRPEFLYCGVCMLYLLAGAGVSAVKVVGRNFRPERIRRDVSFIRKYLDAIVSGEIDRGKYTDTGRRLHREFYGVDCSREECYYLEPRLARGKG